MCLAAGLTTGRDVRAACRVNHFWRAVILKNTVLEKKRKTWFSREISLCMIGTNDAGQENLAERWALHPYILTNYDPTLEDTYRRTVAIDGEPYSVSITGPHSIGAG